MPLPRFSAGRQYVAGTHPGPAAHKACLPQKFTRLDCGDFGIMYYFIRAIVYTLVAVVAQPAWGIKIIARAASMALITLLSGCLEFKAVNNSK